MRRTLAALALAGAVIATTAACETEVDSVAPEAPAFARVYPVQLSDGRAVQCIYLRDLTDDHETTGGPSCDWAGAK